MTATGLSPVPLMPVVAGLRGVGEGELTAYAGRALDRLERTDPTLRAFVPEPGRRARVLAETRALAARYPEPDSRPALFGVPVGVKDLFRVDGLTTTAGSRLDPARFDGAESDLVRRLRAEGCVILGKTEMDEFACCEPGPTCNPHDHRRTPGGSSAGSAAAVAAGLCPLAVGTQTQRSLIGPAAFCGVAAFKPSHRPGGIDGVATAPSADTEGVLTSDVAGLAHAAERLFGVYAEHLGRPPRLGVLDHGTYLRPVTEPVRRAFDGHVAALRATGARIRHCAAPWEGRAEEWMRRFDALLLGELAGVHAAWFHTDGHLYRPRTAAAVRAGAAVRPALVHEALRALGDLRSLIARALDDAGVDCWISPSSLRVAPVGFDETGDVEMTIFWSWAGLPCASVPAGTAPPGLPVGLQCVGRFGEDPVVLDVAGYAERALARLSEEAVR
jgi:Asp-tRNA(Asn)/Glu-tRNA(Gln) amidotransferase A subunit family amidase